MKINEIFKSEIDALTAEDLIRAKKMSHLIYCNEDEINVNECLNYIKKKKHEKIERKYIRSLIRRSNKYSISCAKYISLFHNQNHSCAVCKTHIDNLPKDLSIDHHHTTGKVRGLLCTKCNLALGLLGEDKNIIENLLKYIENNE